MKFHNGMRIYGSPMYLSKLNIQKLEVTCTLIADTQQYRIGSCEFDDIAVRVAARVISHRPETNQIVLDSGFVALSHDGTYCNLPDGVAVFQDHPELK